MTPDPLTHSPTPRHEIERAFESGGSTGGDTTHWSLKILAKAFRQLERENAALVKEREEHQNYVEALRSQYIEEAIQLRGQIADKQQVIHVFAKDIAKLRATLAERDRAVRELQAKLGAALQELVTLRESVDAAKDIEGRSTPRSTETRLAMTSEKPKLKITRCRHDTGRTFIETIEEETLIATITDPSSEMWQLAQQLVSVWNASLESCDQPATPSADVEIATPRIYTRCPACGNDTLTVSDDKHLLCTWISCPDPTLIDRISEVFPHKWEETQRELASLQSARDAEILKLKTERDAALQQAVEARAVTESGLRLNSELIADLADVRAALAERDREIECLRGWKESAMSVMPDYQEIGRLLGLTLGESVHDKIIPGITDLRSQLHAATARAEEAEHDLKLARESDANHEALWKQGAAERIALEAQVSELERVIENLRGWITANAKTSIHGLLEYTDNTVRRKPDLPLIEEVREALSKCVVQLHHIRGGYILGTKIDEAHDAATQLLARLNPTKL